MRTTVLLFIAIVVVACESTPTAPVDAGAVADARPTPFTEEAMRAAQAAFDTKVCAAAEKCDPIAFAYRGGMEACIGSGAARLPLADLAGVYAYGSLLTPEKLLACADALDLSTCEAYARFQFEAFLPDACRTYQYGTLPLASPCRFWNQCASGRCDQTQAAEPGSCGRCVAQQPIGAQCQYYFGCVEGATCRGVNTEARCKLFAEVGQPCDATTPCHFTLVCAGGSCAAPPPDDACDPAVGCATLPLGRYCDPATRKCTIVPIVADGKPCGPTPATFINCEAGSVCARVVRGAFAEAGADAEVDAGNDGGTMSSERFVCVPRLEPGTSCSVQDYPFDNGNPCKRGTCYRQICQDNGAAKCTAPPSIP